MPGERGIFVAFVKAGLQLCAVAGDWHAEHPWCDRLDPAGGAEVRVRGGRQIVRLPLVARKHEIGVLTLVRPIDDAFADSELDLLRLLVDQLAVAIQNARDYREKLDQAIRDPLTGLYNRRFFFEALEKELHRNRRYGSEVSIVIFDVDDFKHINDSYGHALGDEVLREVGRTVNKMVRPIDSFARIGGEEFALLLPETGQLDALLVAERVRAAVAAARVEPDVRVTLSGGVASCPRDAIRREALESRADAALYWCKRNGKDMCAVASEETDKTLETPTPRAVSNLYGIVEMLDADHLYTRSHSANVATYATAIGQELGLSRDRTIQLRRAAFLHDVGKVAIRREILLKPGKLTTAEFEEIKRHPAVSELMLTHAGLEEEARWVAAHHERVDGGGYPRGLVGDEIPIEARIIFVADSFEAMTSDRPYRRGISVAEAMAEIRRCAGTQFDTRVAEVLERLMASGRFDELAVRRDQPRLLESR